MTLNEISRAHVLFTSVDGRSKPLYRQSLLNAEAELVPTPVDDLKGDFRPFPWVLAVVVFAQRGCVITFLCSAHVLADTVVKPSDCCANVCGIAKATRSSASHRRLVGYVRRRAFFPSGAFASTLILALA